MTVKGKADNLHVVVPFRAIVAPHSVVNPDRNGKIELKYTIIEGKWLD